MIIILKPLFEVLTGDVAICDNIIYNYLVMLAVGEVAFRAAWRFVGDAYRMGFIVGKASGSVLHWLIRLFSYVGCAYLIRGGIWLYQLIIGVPHWVWWLVAGIVVTGVLSAILIRLFIKRKAKTTYDTGKQTTN